MGAGDKVNNFIKRMVEGFTLWRRCLSLPTPTGKFYNAWEHSGWGDRITVRNRYGDVDGHLYGVQIGDELRVKLKNGTIARCVFIKVDYRNNPPDMFFGQIVQVDEFHGEPPPEPKYRGTRLI